MEKQLIELNSFVGEHLLTGVDCYNTTSITEYNRGEDCAAVLFQLDGKNYEAIEDPNDGYRSNLEGVFQVEKSPANTFAPVRVLGSMRKSSRHYSGEADIIEFLDLVTGKVVLEIGTDNIDDYYPSFQGVFTPENMAVNQKKEGH